MSDILKKGSLSGLSFERRVNGLEFYTGSRVDLVLKMVRR